MTVFTTAASIALFGLYLCWGPTRSRLECMRLSALLGALYSIALVAAVATMPMYGGSLYWADDLPRAARISDPNLVVFLSVAAIFLLLGLITARQSE
jgi:hypothetical protein